MHRSIIGSHYELHGALLHYGSSGGISVCRLNFQVDLEDSNLLNYKLAAVGVEIRWAFGLYCPQNLVMAHKC